MNKNMFRRVVSFVLIAAMTLGLTACSGGNVKEAQGNKYKIITTIFPEYDWVREIVGQGHLSADKSAAEDYDITMLLDNGVDLHSFQPTAADIANISTCDMFIYVGGESDGWVDDALKEATNKDMIVIDLMDVLKDVVKEEEVVEGMEAEDEDHDHEAADEDHDHEDADEDHDHDHEDEDHEEGHHHEEGEIEYDEHVWLSIKNSMTICEYIADKLTQLDSEHADVFKTNLEEFNGKLSELDNEYKSAVESAKVNTILFGDRFPFRYLTDDYGLNYYAAFVGCSAETEASFETIIFLAGKVDELGLGAICTIENSDQKIANTIKENTKTGDQEILTLNSLQSITSKEVQEGACYYSTMKDNLEVLKKALGE